MRNAKNRRRSQRAITPPGSGSWPRRTALALLGAGIALVVVRTLGLGGTTTTSTSFVIPALSAEAQRGQSAFVEHCQICHGDNGRGTRDGPPLVHRIYEPSHHSDASFVRAVRQGVVAHHWRFGHMPQLPAVSNQELSDIIHYVRTLQRANGIH